MQHENQDEPGHFYNSEAANDEYFRSSQAAAGARVRQAAVMADISFADQQDLYQEILLDLLERAPDYDPTKGSCNTYTGRLSKHCLATFLKNRNTDRKRFEFHSPIEAANDPDFYGSQCGGLYSEVTKTAWSHWVSLGRSRFRKMNTEIRNCEFTFKCPKVWDALAPTPEARIRFCGDCQRQVIFCRTATELKRAIIDNECVAVDIPGPRGPERTLGEPRVKYERN